MSDPIIFGHVVKVFFKDVFSKYRAVFEELGVNPNNGLGSLYQKIQGHPKQVREAAKAATHSPYSPAPSPCYGSWREAQPRPPSPRVP